MFINHQYILLTIQSFSESCSPKSELNLGLNAFAESDLNTTRQNDHSVSKAFLDHTLLTQ
jgi:hypothetical protein